MIANALLIRWHGGWRDRADTDSITARGRREALLGLGAAQSEGEVDRVAAGQLAVFARDRLAIAAELDPVDDDHAAYVGYRVGDTLPMPGRFNDGVAGQRVVAITITEDEDGNLSESAEYGDIVLGDRERYEQAIKKMTDGTLGGQSKVATPAAQVSSSSIDCCPPTVPGGGDG